MKKSDQKQDIINIYQNKNNFIEILDSEYCLLSIKKYKLEEIILFKSCIF